MKLRDYQEAAVNAVIESWKTARSCLIVLPTGCGKTVVFGEIIRRLLTGEIVRALKGNSAEPTSFGPPRRAMILAHRNELIMQAKDKVGKIARCEIGVEMGESEVTDDLLSSTPDVVVSTVQTQITGRMHKFKPGDYGLLVIDEAHHAISKSYRSCIGHYLGNPDCRLLGVTATPDRADQLALGTVFDTVAYEYSVTQAIADGWLVPVNQRLVKVGSLDYSKVSTCAGDFNQGELSEVLEEERNLHGIASPTVEICGSRRAILFAASVKQAERLCEIINRYSAEAQCAPEGTPRVGKAAWLCGKTPKNERADMLTAFREGRLQFVVNVGVLTEGFDDAGVEVVVMARPTKSRALYAQMAGRATRPAAEIAARLGEVEVEGGGGDIHCQPQPQTSTSAAARRRALIAASSKPSCLIIDFVGNSGRHKLITAFDILGGKELDPDEEEARRLAHERCERSEDELDAMETLEKAREEIKVRKEIEIKRRQFIMLRAKYTAINVDPFNPYDIEPPSEQERSVLDRRQLSWKQKQILRERLGVNPDAMATSDACALLNEHFNRVKYGLATLKQSRLLRRHGICTPMSFEDARWTIDRLMTNSRKGW